MAGGLSLYLCASSSSSSSLRLLHFKPSVSAAAFLCRSIKRYCSERHDHNVEQERAPSTAKEFSRVAEEKLLREAEEDLASSQAVKKVYDGPEEAVVGNSKLDSVKKRYEEHVEEDNAADYHKTG